MARVEKHWVTPWPTQSFTLETVEPNHKKGHEVVFYKDSLCSADDYCKTVVSLVVTATAKLTFGFYTKPLNS